MAGAGRVVILNGASSAGKTTLARSFIQTRADGGDCWVSVGLDDFLGKLPWQWFATPQVEGPYGWTGVRFEATADGVTVTVGELGRNLLAAYRGCVAVWARTGFNVVVDEVAIDAQAIQAWAEALAGLSVDWVAVRCQPQAAEARERERGDRAPGLARGLSEVVHRHAAYDLELDTTTSGPDELVARLSLYLDVRRP